MAPREADETAIVALQELCCRRVPVLRAHQAVLLVPHASDLRAHVDVRVPPDVQRGPHALDLSLQLQAAARHGGRPADREFTDWEEMAEGDRLALAPPLLLD